MPNVLAKLGAEVLVSTPTPPPPAVMAIDRRAARPTGSPTSCGRPGPTSGRCIDPGGEHITLVDDEGQVLTDDEALLLLLDLVVATRIRRARVALPVAAPMAAEHICARGRRRDRVDQAVGLPPDGGGAAPEGSPSPPARWGASSSPRFLPAFDAVATLVHLLGMLAAHRRAPVEAGEPAARRPHRPRGGRHPVGAEGHGDAHRWWSGRRDATVVLVDGVKVLEADGWALVRARPRRAGHPRLGRGPQRGRGRGPRAQEHAIRIRQMLQ